jgi:hypothetical protein
MTDQVETNHLRVLHARYYRELRASQKLIRSEGENLDDWLRFFLTRLKKQKDILLGKIEREQLLEFSPPPSTLLTFHNNSHIISPVVFLAIRRVWQYTPFRKSQGVAIWSGIETTSLYS